MNRLVTMRWHWAWDFLLSFAAALLMVSSESLWIDEGQTWVFAREPSMSGWMAALLSNTKSEAQMPLSMLVAWLGAKVVGQSEWQLRSLNALWVGIAGIAIGWLGRTLKLRVLLPLFLIHPFVWYYANEARPYALLIGISAWLLALWVSFHLNPTLSVTRLWTLGAIVTLGLASSLLFGFALVGVGFAFGVTALINKIRFERRYLIPIAVTSVALAALMAYYLWTLLHGARGARIWSVGVSNVAFALYELLGFAGLGPPRHELRELARSSAGLGTLMSHGYYVIGPALLAAVYLLLIQPLWRLRRESLWVILTGGVALSTAAIFVVSVAFRFPFWGRHLAFILPSTVLLISKALPEVTNGLRRKSLLVALCLLLLASSLSLRFSPQYRKDDYRSASGIAKVALLSGKTVWWVADRVAGEYYGLGEHLESGELIWFHNNSSHDLTNRPAPDLICFSKPDVSDAQNSVGSYIREHDFRPVAELTAFRLYTRGGALGNTGSKEAIPATPPVTSR